VRLIGALLRIVYEAIFWSRDKSEGGASRPLLVVMEEAHRYLSGSGDNAGRAIAQRIVKEGRKYGIGAMIVSQRPSEVDETILSQCGTVLALRLANPIDQQRVRGSVPDSLSGLMEMLPVLRTGEAVVTGEAVRLPLRARMTLPRDGRLPDSQDPDVITRWSVPRLAEDYAQVVTAWRAQSPRAVVRPTPIQRLPVDETER
jgi:DNA helicase HerA-like ATPase